VAFAALLLASGACDGSSSHSGGAQSSGAVVYPLKVSGNGRLLVDQGHDPFLVQAESAWGLVAAATIEDAELYLENRRQKGFNAMLVRLLEHKWTDNPPRNIYGQGPFTTPGDFATPNEAYFAHVDQVIQRAYEKGILVLLAPAYLGYNGGDEGWFQEMTANGTTKLRNYGRYLGQRYRNFPNILWVQAGDFNPPTPDLVRAVALGILDYDTVHLHTAHCGRGNSAMDCFPNETWLTVNASYTSDITYPDVLRDYHRVPFKPFFLLDAEYENTNGSTPASLRAQAYWAVLSGAQGQLFGVNPTYHFEGPTLYPAPYGWEEGLESPGSHAMPRVTALFDSRDWYDLVPDDNHDVVTSGYGSFGSTNYVTAARTPDGRLVMAYIPSTGTGTRSLTVDMSELAGQAQGRWYNPTSGAYTDIAGSPFANTGSRTFTTPGNNGTDTNDWALVLEIP
jgi:hypothetical protein